MEIEIEMSQLGGAALLSNGFYVCVCVCMCDI